MNEQVETKKEESFISNEELESIEREVLSKTELANKKLKTEIEAQVRKEFETEQKLKELEAEKKKLEDAVLKQKEEREKTASELKAELEKLKEQMGSSKSVVNNNSPFGKNNTDSPVSNRISDLTKEQIIEIEEESKKAFMDKLGIREDRW
jgi:hypothetical protein